MAIKFCEVLDSFHENIGLSKIWGFTMNETMGVMKHAAVRVEEVETKQWDMQTSSAEKKPYVRSVRACERNKK
jgi:hypothetical protein